MPKNCRDVIAGRSILSKVLSPKMRAELNRHVNSKVMSTDKATIIPPWNILCCNSDHSRLQSLDRWLKKYINPPQNPTATPPNQYTKQLLINIKDVQRTHFLEMEPVDIWWTPIKYKQEKIQNNCVGLPKAISSKAKG